MEIELTNACVLRLKGVIDPFLLQATITAAWKLDASHRGVTRLDRDQEKNGLRLDTCRLGRYTAPKVNIRDEHGVPGTPSAKHCTHNLFSDNMLRSSENAWVSPELSGSRWPATGTDVGNDTEGPRAGRKYGPVKE